jgi:sulfatase maturation enzyme AslB (radical SAM superfamily)
MLSTQSDSSEVRSNGHSQEDEDALIRDGYEAFLEKRFPDSVAHFTRAARLGSAQADYWLGFLTLDHGCAEQGLSGGEAALARAADAGHAPAATRLAAELLTRKDNEAALTEAVGRLRAAVSADEPMAHYLLANCLRWGIGLPADPPQATHHLRVAADAGIEGAAEALAELELASSEAPATQQEWMERGPEDALAPGPRSMTLEITTRCNLTCVMCPHGLTDGMLVKRDAPDVMIEAVLRSLDDLDEIHPTGVGEPLLADGFWRIVDTLNGRASPKLVFHTNGMLLTERNVERLSAAPIARVNISVDAADPMTYRRIRGAEMRKTLDGIRRLVQAPSFAGEAPPVCISMVLMRENIEEAPQFVRMAAELGVRHVYFEHLTEPHLARETWKVSRGNFNFNYAEQDLHDEPDYADKHIILAMDEADRLGIVIEGYEVLLSPENASHQQRRCRTGAFAPSSI